MIKKGLILNIAFLTLLPLAVQADGFDRSAQATPKSTPVPPGSDAQFDKRLPPVLPGEIVNDSGNKMKVWSTTGPVPVASAPQPWAQTPPPVAVIVDGDTNDNHNHNHHGRGEHSRPHGNAGHPRTLDQQGLHGSGQ